MRAFALFCDRQGVRVITLPIDCVSGLGNVSARLDPDAVVIAGSGQPIACAVAWAERVCATVGPLPQALFRAPGFAADTAGLGGWVLPDAPHAAHSELLGRLDRELAAA